MCKCNEYCLKDLWNKLEVCEILQPGLKHLSRYLMAGQISNPLPVEPLSSIPCPTYFKSIQAWMRPDALRHQKEVFCSTPFISTLPDVLFSVLLQLFNFFLYLASAMRESLQTECSAMLAKHEDFFFCKNIKRLYMNYCTFSISKPQMIQQIMLSSLKSFCFLFPFLSKTSVSW